MKTKKYFYPITVITFLLLTLSCKQEVIKLTEPVVPVETYSPGSADFSKYVAIGNSLSAGYQAGALFNEGQKNSFPAIISKQFSLVHGSTLAFNQPDINAVNGNYGDVINALLGINGRLVLYTSSGIASEAKPTPVNEIGKNVSIPDVYRIEDVLGNGLFGGNKAELNNFAVPGIILGDVSDSKTGANPLGGSIKANPYYYRFATNPGTSTILGDALAVKPTFITFELGSNDVLGYATRGADPTKATLTPVGTFRDQYSKTIKTIMDSDEKLKMVVSTVPDVTSIPFFTAVPWKTVPINYTDARAVSSTLGNGYNGFLSKMVDDKVISEDEKVKRTLNFNSEEGKTLNNPILIEDEYLTDLSQYMTGDFSGLLPYKQARHTNPTDLVTLSAGAVIGATPKGSPANQIYGVTIPLGDQYILTKEEIPEIKTATDSYNSIINEVAGQYPDRIAVADMHASFNKLVTNKAFIADGVIITPSFVPPSGGFSEDGVHPNSRGYAFMANIFIDAINAKFGAKVPKAKLSDYKGTGLPLGLK